MTYQRHSLFVRVDADRRLIPLRFPKQPANIGLDHTTAPRWTAASDDSSSSGASVTSPDQANLEESTGSDGDERYRLIERFFPSDAVSEQSRTERYQRGKTPHTIFTWWARRPFAAARGVAATSLIESDSLVEGARELIDDYCRQSDPAMLRMALEPLMEASDQRVLDLFGGGATIPMEAARLGARAYTVENNQLAHFNQTALLQLSQQGEEIAAKVETAGRSLLTELREETSDFFPARDAGDDGRTIAYLWSREVACPDCGGWLSLMRRPWLSKRADRRWYVHRRPVDDRREYSATIRREGEPDDAQAAWDGRDIECPFCDHRIERADISEAIEAGSRDRMVAVCTSEGRRARTRKAFFEADTNRHFPSRGKLLSAITADLNAMGETLPDVSLPRWSGVTNPALYGMARHVELFNLRQRAVLVRLCRLIREHYEQWTDDWGAKTASVVAAFLSGLIDQLVDWNGRLATWISQNEQVGRGLSGPGMAMIWDHVEIDPVEEAPANLWDKLERIVQGIKAIPEARHTPTAIRGDARNLPFDDDYFDIVATDPPYFDNIFYNVLADCIYVWKRLALREIFPGHFVADKTDSSRELTMNRHLHGTTQEAVDYYTDGMQTALAEARRVMNDNGILAMIFAHGTVDGWASIIEAIVGAELQLVAAWPMYVERTDRPRSMGSRAINTSFVLVARQRHGEPGSLEWRRFDEMLRHRLDHESDELDLDDHYGPNTRGRTLFGLGLSLFTEAGNLREDGDLLSVHEVVERIASVVEEMVGEEGWGVERR